MISQELFRKISRAIRVGDSEAALAEFRRDSSLLRLITPLGSWLHVAASRGQLDIIKGLVQLGADVNLRGGPADCTAIHDAAADGHEDIVRYLLEAGATLDVSEPERNPLFSAVYGGNIEIVRLLIEAGIDSKVRYTGDSMKDMDARAFAIEHGQLDIAAYLADA